MEDILFKYVAEIGVPASVCFAVIFGVRNTLKDLNTTVANNTRAIERLTDSFAKLDLLDNDIKELKFKLEAIYHAKS